MVSTATGSGYRAEDFTAFDADDPEGDDEELEALESSLDESTAFAEDDEAGDDEFSAEDDENLDEDDEGAALEADDESSGYDEGRFENVGMTDPESDASVRLVADRRAQDAKLRADARARSAMSTQRAANLYATSVQRRLDQQLRMIPPSAPVKVGRIDPLRGSGVVTARLPNGRTTRMMITPPLATQLEVNRLTRQINLNDQRQATAIRRHNVALARMKRTLASGHKLHKAELLKVSKDLNKRITDGDAGLDKRIAKEVGEQRKASNKQDIRILREIRQRQKRATWNSVLIASAIPLFAAFGERATVNGNPFTKKNLILTGSLVAWMFSDDLVGHLVGRDSKTWRNAVNAWSYVAPIGNAATVYFLLKDEQHERFVSGVTSGITTSPYEIPLGNLVGADHLKQFQTMSNPVALAAIRSATASGAGTAPTRVEASVKDGKLTLTLGGAAAPFTAEVAWAVDTQGSSSTRSS